MQITTLEVAGIIPALKGMRNPMNSHYLQDTHYITGYNAVEIGENDMKLAKSLIKGGSEHRKFLRQIRVWADFDMPRYWWSEADTYHFNTKNSESTMHKLLSRKIPISKEDFVFCEEDLDVLEIIITRLNVLREEYLSPECQSKTQILVRAKRLLPEGWLQLRTVDHSYEEIRNMYSQRKSHRLKEEWIDVFCRWVESLPYAQEFLIE